MTSLNVSEGITIADPTNHDAETCLDAEGGIGMKALWLTRYLALDVDSPHSRRGQRFETPNSWVDV